MAQLKMDNFEEIEDKRYLA